MNQNLRCSHNFFNTILWPFCAAWSLRRVVRSLCHLVLAPCGPCAVWSLHSVVLALCGPCIAWSLHCAVLALCGLCAVWSLRRVLLALCGPCQCGPGTVRSLNRVVLARVVLAPCDPCALWSLHLASIYTYHMV